MLLTATALIGCRGVVVKPTDVQRTTQFPFQLANTSENTAPMQVLPMQLRNVCPLCTSTEQLMEQFIFKLTGTLDRTGEHVLFDVTSHVLPFNKHNRDIGQNYCVNCYTMIGNNRLWHLASLLVDVFKHDVPGDFIETGTWHGGTCMLARAMALAYRQDHRRVVLADSFQGLPPSSTRADTDAWAKDTYFQVSMKDVQAGFQRFGLDDTNQVQYRKGFFNESMPLLRQELQHSGRKLAILRIDGDMYESYMDVLYNLYEFLSVGGYVIKDDTGGATTAVNEFRTLHGISEPQFEAFGTRHGHGLYWKKMHDVPVNYVHYLEWNKHRVHR